MNVASWLEILKYFFYIFFLCRVAFADEKFITDITPNQVRDVGESVDLSCTVDGAEHKPFWLKRNRDRQSDLSILSIGAAMAFSGPRLNVTQNGNTYILSVSLSSPTMQGANE